jgi:FkbM family methyltransferase
MMTVAFILAATDAGPMIVNRLDFCSVEQGYFGVGASLLATGRFDHEEVEALTGVIKLRRQCFGDGVMVLDIGANIGTHTVEWAKAMTGWGSVLAVEAQERVFYALAGNIALNNLFNARAIHAAAGHIDGTINVPTLNHEKPASFGSLELHKVTEEYIGQEPEGHAATRMLKIDSIAPLRVDLIKLDIEGMELDALAGAVETIIRCHPVLFVERVKCGDAALHDWLLGHDYVVHPCGMNYLAIHRSDKTREHIVIG